MRVLPGLLAALLLAGCGALSGPVKPISPGDLSFTVPTHPPGGEAPPAPPCVAWQAKDLDRVGDALAPLDPTDPVARAIEEWLALRKFNHCPR